MIDYALWEVIENGATLPKTQVIEGVITLLPITTAEEKAQRRLEVKDRSTLMMGILNEYQLKFNSIKDAKQLLEAVENRFSFKSFQPNSPQLAHEDLQQIHPDDMKEMYLRWQVAMLTMRARRFLRNKGRKLIVNGNETIRFDKSKVKCYNYHKNGHFARECTALRNQGNKNKESSRKSLDVETSLSTDLVSCDGLGGYDWSDQAEEGPNYALMAFSSSSSDSKHVVENCKAMSSEEEPKIVRKHDDVPIIKELVSDDEEKDVSQPKIEKKIVRPSIVKKEFVKSKQQEKTARKTVKQVENHRQDTHSPRVIKESLVKMKQKGAILELKRRHLKKTVNCYNNDGEDMFKHINIFLKVVEPLKVRGLTHDLSLSGAETGDEDDPDVIDNVPEIFKIDDDLFKFDSPLCIAFEEFNHLLKIDHDLFTCDT
uniref:Uncharacterized protein n=1 Tax=Tanacetum cinerariifolium TaxID=118510 RepID=A0A6L2NCW5_TANCI|nr:hypothetical protein [Tanacetum cinerariifolium]